MDFDPPQRGPFCGECGESMQMEYCTVTGVKHEYMTLYKRRQVVEVDMGSTEGGSEAGREIEGSPVNPLVEAFPHDGEGRHGDGKIAEEKKVVRIEEPPRVTCLGISSVVALQAALVLVCVAFILYMVAGGLQSWFAISLEKALVDSVVNATDTTRLTYGLLRMCNDTSGEAEDCGRVVIYSERCNTDGAQQLITGAAVLYVLGIVFLVACGIIICWVIYGKLQGFPSKQTILFPLVSSCVATACGITSPALTMFLFTTTQCSHDMCELLTWTYLQATPTVQMISRSGTCKYGPSLYLSWVGSGLSFVTTAILICLYTLRYERATGHPKRRKRKLSGGSSKSSFVG
eukprot:TRINITY_DN34425_c0_g1_i1.p1 TRINITY_DN34425_c0_g1~~TRINITY_DN34425_c0_g1_i1.p1  ORF type:complete len:346 (+),score=60.13 TRINITY_DN34425_c0_g1_i1:48-1085(+)